MCICIITQDVCQYWPASGEMQVEEFTVSALEEETLSGLILRTFSLFNRKVGSGYKKCFVLIFW